MGRGTEVFELWGWDGYGASVSLCGVEEQRYSSCDLGGDGDALYNIDKVHGGYGRSRFCVFIIIQ